MINNAIKNIHLLFMDGENIRDWLHVYDHCTAIDLIIHKGKKGEIYNIGGHNERTNLEVVMKILKELKKPKSLIKYVEDRKGHDKRYAINPNKITRELGWKQKYDFDKGIIETIKWNQQNQDWIKSVINKK